MLLLGSVYNNTGCQDRLSVDYSDQFLLNYLRQYGCEYCKAVLFHGFEQLYLVTGDSAYINMVETVTDNGLSVYGDGLLMMTWSVDDIPMRRELLTMYQLTGDDKFKLNADNVFDSIQNAPRTSYGGFWHKRYYPNEMWLDGIYMASPFYAQYDKMFDKPELFDDVARQVTEMYVHSWDSVAKLPCHGWYDANNNPSATPPYWADPVTGKSPVFWGRSIGWYAMAIVDILDYLPKNHSMRDSIIGIFNNLAEGIAEHQDPDSLVWWEVMDQPDREGNWIESSASCMFVYALAKGVRMGYVDSSYLETATTGYQGILDRFTDTISNRITINNVCEGTSVGANYAYYAGRARYSSSRYVSHVDGAFVLASIEMEMMDSVYPPGLLAYDSVTYNAIHISWINNQHNVLGYILERKTDGDFSKIAELGVDTTYSTDSIIEPGTKYIYRVCAYTENDTSRWSNYLTVTSAHEGGLPLQAFLPYPEDSAAFVELFIIQEFGLGWRKGFLADYHKIYFGTTNPPPFVADVYDIPYFPQNVSDDSVYYWRIDEVNEKGTTPGETWMFWMSNFITKETLHTSNSLYIFPNPGSEKLNIEGLKIHSSISIYDLKGMLYYTNVAKGEILTIDIENWQKGIYILQVKGTEGIIYKKLIVK